MCIRDSVNTIAISGHREVFEKSSMGEPARTGIHYEESYGGGGDDWDVVVPYCTAGYRSGQYAKKLMDLG